MRDGLILIAFYRRESARDQDLPDACLSERSFVCKITVPNSIAEDPLCVWNMHNDPPVWAENSVDLIKSLEQFGPLKVFEHVNCRHNIETLIWCLAQEWLDLAQNQRFESELTAYFNLALRCVNAQTVCISH
jgi:hypothetical protein